MLPHCGVNVRVFTNAPCFEELQLQHLVQLQLLDHKSLLFLAWQLSLDVIPGWQQGFGAEGGAAKWSRSSPGIPEPSPEWSAAVQVSPSFLAENKTISLVLKAGSPIHMTFLGTCGPPEPFASPVKVNTQIRGATGVQTGGDPRCTPRPIFIQLSTGG